MRPVFITLLALAFTACSSPAATEDREAISIGDEVKFSDVLAQYQALNTRLESVAAPLQLSNAALCPETERSLGLTVHTVSDYPLRLQSVAESLLNVSERLSIRTVRAGSPADKAGLRPEDDLVRINDTYMTSGKTVQRYYAAVARTAYAQPSVTLQVRREGQIIDATIAPETVCGYPVNVIFSERVNGHTDGQEILVTSELLRTVDDDVNLALIVAHEMAHAIAGHMDRQPSKALELEADRMALIMMARAGFNIDEAIGYWRYAAHPDQRGSSSSHPSIEERYNNFEKTRTEITAQRSRGEILHF